MLSLSKTKLDYIRKAIGDKKVDEHDSYLPRFYALDDVEIPEYKHVGPVIGTVKIEEKKGISDLMKEIVDEIKEKEVMSITKCATCIGRNCANCRNQNMYQAINEEVNKYVTVEYQGRKCVVEHFSIMRNIDELDKLEVACTIPPMFDKPKAVFTSASVANDDHIPKIKEVIFNPPATIVFWKDGTKSVVKATNEEFDPEKGLAMAIARKVYGNKHDYYNRIAKWTKRYKKPESQKAVEMGKALAEGFNKGLEEVEKKTAKPVAPAKRVVDPKAKSGKR